MCMAMWLLLFFSLFVLEMRAAVAELLIAAGMAALSQQIHPWLKEHKKDPGMETRNCTGGGMGVSDHMKKWVQHVHEKQSPTCT